VLCDQENDVLKILIRRVVALLQSKPELRFLRCRRNAIRFTKAGNIDSNDHILVLFDFLLNIADLRGDVLQGILEVGILHLQL